MMKETKCIIRSLRKFKDDLSFRVQEYSESRGIVLSSGRKPFYFPKEHLIGKVLDFFTDLEIRRSNLFKSAFRALARAMKRG